MRTPSWLPLLLVLLLPLSCKNGDVSPKSTPESKSAGETGKNVPVDPLGLPPLDDACTTDADCTVSSRPKVEEGFCCHGCAHVPAARSWRLAVVENCNRYNEGKTPGCPKLNCNDVPDVVCVEGKCRFRK